MDWEVIKLEENKELTLFEQLFKKDVTKYIEKKKVKTKKGDTFTLDYLSWAYAHAEMKKVDPNAHVIEREFPHYRLLGDHLIEEMKPWLADQAGAMVNVTVQMSGKEESEWLYVMDNSNQAVSEPNAAQINKTLKRCFVKALAKFGLGLSLYIGEDTKDAADKKSEPMTLDKALAYTVTFGKHNGKTLEAINEEDTSYLKWLSNSDKTKPELKSAVQMILNPVEKVKEQPQPPRQDNYQAREEELLVELEEKMQSVLNKTGMEMIDLRNFVVKSINENKGTTYQNFQQVDKGLAIGILKTLELKYEQKQREKTIEQNTQQGSMLEGMTNKPLEDITWGAK